MSLSIVTLALLATTLAACSRTTRIPIHAAEDLAERGIETVVLMPIIDVRFDRFEYVRLATYVRNVTRTILERKGYTIVEKVLAKGEDAVTTGDLAGMNVEELAKLGEEGDRSLLFVYFDDLKRDRDDRGNEFRVKLSALIIDRPSGELLWRDQGVGDSHLSGLLTLMAPPSSEYEAVHNAVRNLFATFPKRQAGQR